MSEPFEHETETPASQEGARRRAAFLAHHQANSDMAKAASMQAYGESEDRRVTQAGQAGLYQHMTPYDRGAVVAAMQPVVGSAYGGRPLTRLGGTFQHSEVGCAPAPARVDMRFVNQPSGPPTGESPLARFMRERQQ